MSTNPAKSFEKAALAAFPWSMRPVAMLAMVDLSPLVDGYHPHKSRELSVLGSSVYIPERLHFLSAVDRTIVDSVSLASACLLTRSTDGFLRQRALRRVVDVQEAWVLPFVTLALG